LFLFLSLLIFYFFSIPLIISNLNQGANILHSFDLEKQNRNKKEQKMPILMIIGQRKENSQNFLTT